MAKVVIFGLRDVASLAHFYLTHDSEHQVVAFSVNEQFMPNDAEFEGLPIVPFENAINSHPPGEFSFFAPMSERNMNRDRASVYSEIKAQGYSCVSYISSHATTFPEADIGENCFILEDNTLQPFTPIGNNVVMWSGNHIGHHGSIADHVYFTSHVVLSGHCTVEPYCFFGVNATVRDGTTVAEGSLVAMSATITRNTEPWSVYMGTPARRGKVSSRDVDL